MENGKKTSTLIIGIILLIVIVSGLTYAWLVWSKDTVIEGTSKCFDITYTGGADISANLVLVDTPISDGKITYGYNMANSVFAITLNDNCTTTGQFNLILKNTTVPTAYISGNSKNALKYALVSGTSVSVGTSYTVLSSGSINTTSDINIYTGNLSKGVTDNYVLIVYVDGNSAGEDSKGTSYSGYVTANAAQTLS